MINDDEISIKEEDEFENPIFEPDETELQENTFFNSSNFRFIRRSEDGNEDMETEAAETINCPDDKTHTIILLLRGTNCQP